MPAPSGVPVYYDCARADCRLVGFKIDKLEHGRVRVTALSRLDSGVASREAVNVCSDWAADDAHDLLCGPQRRALPDSDEVMARAHQHRLLTDLERDIYAAAVRANAERISAPRISAPRIPAPPPPPLPLDTDVRTIAHAPALTPTQLAELGRKPLRAGDPTPWED